MKKTVFLIAALTTLLFTSCGRNAKSQLIKQPEEKRDDVQWKIRFKNLVMCHCVLEGINDNKIKLRFFEEDKTFHDPVDVPFKDGINEILIPIIQKIRQDSIASLTTVGEGAQGKHIFSSCLHYYKSESLDSAANLALWKWKHTNVDSILAIKAPAF